MNGGTELAPDTPRQQRDDYYPIYDWLRGLLAGIVILAHQGLIQWHYAGNLAVQVFFALSGWLIGGILLRLNRADLPRFYFNRCTRIWAPYFVALGLVIAVSLARDHIGAKWGEFVFYEATFVYNDFGPPQLADYRDQMPLQGSSNHFWSVNVEEQFYLVAPLLLVVVASEFSRSLIVWAIICVVTFLVDLYVPIPITSASIALGVTAAIAVRKFGPLHLVIGSRIALTGIFALTAVGMWQDWNYGLLAPFFSIAVVLLLAIKGPQHRIGAIVGGISYPIYLNQWIGSFAAHAMLKPFGMRDSNWFHPLAIGANIVIAYVLYRLVDYPIHKYRSGWFTPRRGRIAMFVAYATLIIGFIGGLTYRFILSNT